MRDLWGIVLLITSLAGSIKGRWLPYFVPQIIAAAALFLLFYRGLFIKSKFSFIYSSTLWISLTWIAGKAMEESWGNGILMQVPFWMMLLFTPVVGYVHQRIFRRFNPVPTRGLELEHGRNPQALRLEERWPFRKNSSCKQGIDLILFDLGEEVQFKNK